MKRIAVLILTMSAALAQTGKELYDKSCRSCHGADGAGNAAIAKALKVELRHLGSKEVQAKSDDQLKKEILEGIGKMKPVKLADGPAGEVVKHVRTMKQ